MNNIVNTINKIDNARQQYVTQVNKYIDNNNFYTYNWLIGIILYIIIFVVCIPIFLYTYYKSYLIYYLPNIDIIAMILTLSSTVYPAKIPYFFDLYSRNNVKWYHLLSTLSINVFVLYWMFIIALHHSNNMSEHLFVFTIILIFAYFLPTYYIPYISRYLHKKYDINLSTWLGTAATVLLLIIIIEKKLVTALLPLHLINKKHINFFD